MDRGPARSIYAAIIRDQPRRDMLEAAVDADGRVRALSLRPDRGLSARIPARARAGHALSHARQPHRRLRHPPCRVRNRVVVTNKTPTGLNRGFGGPQVYFALERLMQRIAVELGLDPARRDPPQLSFRRGAFPYRAPTGALLDSGDYTTALDMALARRQASPNCASAKSAARAEGRIYGIGLTAAVVEPSRVRTWATSRPC